MVTSSPSLRRLNIQYSLIQIFFWASNAAFCGFQAALLFNRGFSSGDVGIFSAVRCLSGIFSQPILGGWIDRHPKIPMKLPVGFCLVIALAFHIAFMAIPFGFWGTMLIMLVLGMLELNAAPMMDSLAVQFINSGVHLNYSFCRGFGSISYAIACVLLGQQIAVFGSEAMLWTHLVTLVLLTASIFLFPSAPRLDLSEQGYQSNPHSIPEILRSNKSFTLMIVASFLVVAASNPLVSFIVNFTTAHGGTDQHTGLALFIMAASEMPAAFVFPYLWRKIGSSGCMLWAITFIALKPLAFLLAPNLAAFILVQSIQALGYGIYISGCVFFTNECVDPADRVRGQTLMVAASGGLGGMIGNLLGGFIIDLAGLNAMLIIMSIIGLSGIIPAVLAVRCHRRKR